MILASTIIAIALGLTPADGGRQVVQIDPASLSRQIGRYSETTDRNGVRHLRGFDHYGRPYNATVYPNGKVSCVVGGQVVEFTASEAV